MCIYPIKKHPSFYQNLPHSAIHKNGTPHTPYTYLIGWTEYNKWYYGRRTAEHCHPMEFFLRGGTKRKSYFTSSKQVREFVRLHGEPDVIQIRKVFNDTCKCVNSEEVVLRRMDASHSVIFLNKTNGDKKWDRTGISVDYSITKERMLMDKFNVCTKEDLNKQILNLLRLYDFEWTTIYKNVKLYAIKKYVFENNLFSLVENKFEIEYRQRKFWGLTTELETLEMIKSEITNGVCFLKDISDKFKIDECQVRKILNRHLTKEELSYLYSFIDRKKALRISESKRVKRKIMRVCY